MPRISEFFGIVIRMYYDDHLPPHFHAEYSGEQIAVGIDPLGLIAGTVPPRVLGLIMEWAASHQPELAENWERARAGLPLQQIDPLD